MNKLNKESKVYVVQYNEEALVIHYDNNIHCYNSRKDIHVFTDSIGDLHTLMTESLKIDKREIETIIIDPLLVNYKLKSCYILFAGFRNLKRIIGLEYLNTSEVVNMNKMFFGCKNLTSLDVSSFDTSKVIDMHSMFNGCYHLENLDVSKFNTANVTDISNMFFDCICLTELNVSNFNTSNVTDMSGMFFNCSSLTSIDVRNFNTSRVTNMSWVFAYCKSLTNLVVSNFNTSNVTDMAYMFSYCENLKTVYVGNDWNTNKVEDSKEMFANCPNLVGGKGTRFDSGGTDKIFANIDEGISNPGYLTAKK